MKVLFIGLLLSGLVAGEGLESLLNLCANPPKTPPVSLSDKISLPEQYKISGSVTDWMKSITSLLQESSTKDYRVLLRQSHDQTAERWVQSLTGEQQIIFVNATNGSCNANAPKAELFRVSRFDSIIGNDTSSLHRIIQGVIESAKSHQGFVLEGHVEVVGGVNVKKWISCIEGTANETKVLLEVRFAGEDTMRPALASFSNPIALSVRLAELESFNSTVAINHVSVELDRYELPVDNEANIEHGIICDNMNGTQIQLKPLDEYAAVLEYYDYVNNRSQIVDVLYSKTRQIVIVAGNNFEYGVKLFKKSEYLNGTDYILHDFKYGYEFTMSQGACKKFSALTDGTADVISQQSNLTMQSMERLLVDMELRWYAHQDETDLSGIKYKTFRAFDSESGFVIELHLTEDGDVHSLTSYRNRQLARTLTVSRKPVETSRLNQRELQLSDCYDDGKFDNGTLIMQIKDKKLSDLKKVGLNNLNDAVVASISKNVNPIIPYRVATFWVDNTDGGLSVVLRIAEKTELQPGPVGYNLTSELSTVEIFKLMNSTMSLEKMPFEVDTVDGKEQWVADANTVKVFPDNNSGFVGYTGGAMFVLTVFCLIIGVAIGAVGVFVATRRQRISTLAYQVFE